MVTDNSTGLIWQDTTPPNSARSYEKNWSEAVSYCSFNNHGGFSDWRVPTQQELTMLLDYSSNPRSIESVFNYVGGRYYWSTTGGVVGDSSKAWGGVDFTDFYENDESKTNDSNHIRCVR